MSRLDELIRRGREHTALDFKQVQYARKQHEALLKDVLSMANAHIGTERHIVCGVALAADGSRTFAGVPRDNIVDAAIYQQLVHENIEPDIHLDYVAHEVDGVIIGVILLSNCVERPYAMRKDFSGSLRRGDMWIRKGTQQMRITRADLERIYAERRDATGFDGRVRMTFDAPGELTTMILPAVETIELASDRAATRITEILEERRIRQRMGYIDLNGFQRPLRSLLSVGPTPYEDRPSETLEGDLQQIRRSDGHIRTQTSTNFTNYTRTTSTSFCLTKARSIWNMLDSTSKCRLCQECELLAASMRNRSTASAITTWQLGLFIARASAGILKYYLNTASCTSLTSLEIFDMAYQPELLPYPCGLYWSKMP
jgi:hypothetical protein